MWAIYGTRVHAHNSCRLFVWARIDVKRNMETGDKRVYFAQTKASSYLSPHDLVGSKLGELGEWLLLFARRRCVCVAHTHTHKQTQSTNAKYKAQSTQRTHTKHKAHNAHTQSTLSQQNYRVFRCTVYLGENAHETLQTILPKHCVQKKAFIAPAVASPIFWCCSHHERLCGIAGIITIHRLQQH